MATVTAAKKIIVPWDQVAEGYVLPEGKYVLRIVEARAGQSQSGEQRVEIQFVVLAPDKHKGRKVTIFYNFNAPGLRALRELLQGIGFEVPSKAAALNLSKLEGKTLIAEAKVQEGKQGGKFQILQNIKPYGKNEPEPEEDDVEEDAAEDDLVEDDDLDFDDDDL